MVVATPDHTHAVASVAAMRAGKHVYCEKPLCRTISEVRHVTELARETNRVTQMGTQIHAGSNYRRVVELVRSGAIGEVSEVHVWVGSSTGGRKRYTQFPAPVPGRTSTGGTGGTLAAAPSPISGVTTWIFLSGRST